MSALKPVGSEKLPLQEKIERIKQIAGISSKPSNVTNYSNTHYSVKGQDGNVYAIIKENKQYFIKSGKDENNLSHIDGQLGSANRNETFTSYSTALKRLNFKMKSINEANNYGVIEEQKKVLKIDLPTPEPEVEEDMDFDMDMGSDDMGIEGEEMDMDMDVEGGDEGDDEEMEMDMDIDVEGGDGAEEEDAVKSIQKLTGKLGQKLRKADGQGALDSETIKYVLNSVISAVNLDNLDSEDREEIVEKFEETDSEYDDLDDMGDMESSGEEEFDMGDDEEMEMDFDMGDDGGDLDLDENIPAMMGAAGAAIGGWAGEKALEKTLRSFKKSGTKMDFSDDELANIFQPTDGEELAEGYDKVSSVINNYFKVSKEEKANNKQKRNNFLDSKLTKARKITSILEHTETIEQESASRKFLTENDNIEVVGKNTKGSLVFNSNGKVTEISRKGLKS